MNNRCLEYSPSSHFVVSNSTIHLPRLIAILSILSILLILSSSATIAGDANNLKFDFTPAAHSPASGWTAVGSKTLFSAEKGYGWTRRWGNAYLHNGAKVNGPLLKGFIQADNPAAKEGVFKIVVPNGIYEVEVVVGSAIKTEGRKNICVSLNGKVLISPPGVGGYGAVVKRRLPAVVENGILEIRFFISGKGRLGLYAVSAVEVKDTAKSKQLKERWIDAVSTKELKRKKKIEINGKEYTEIGRRREPELGSWAAEFAKSGTVLFTRGNPGDIYDYSVPKRSEVVREIAKFAAPGDVVSFPLAVFALKELSDVRVGAAAMTCGKNAIPAENIDIRTVTCHWQSPSESISGTAKYAAELLEKNIPFSLKEHRTQPLFINVRIPIALPPGIYTSNLVVSPMNAPKSTVRVSIRVLPLKIVVPKDKTWHLYNDSTRWFLMNDTQLQNEIRDIADHGINSLKLGYAPYCGTFIERNGKIVDADFGRMGEGMRMAAKFGIDNSVFISSTNAMLAHLCGWRPSTSGSAKVAIVEIEDTGRKIKVAKLKTTASSDRAAISLSKPICIAVGEPLRLSVRYKSTGSIKGTLGIKFQTLRRIRTNAGTKSVVLPSTNGKWKSVSILTTVPGNAPETMVSVVVAGAAGEMFVDEIKLLKSDGLVNRLVNGQFDRGFAMKNFETKWPQEFMGEYTDAVKAHLKAAKRMGFKNAYMEGKDEAGASPKYEISETQELAGAKLAGKVWCNLSMDLAEKAKDNLDGICFYSEMLGSADFSDKLLKHYHDLGKKLYVISSGTYAGQDYDLMPNRHGVGLGFWKSGFDGTAIWTFQRSCGNPFDDFDTRYRDHFLVYPPHVKGGEPIPTIAWEGIREGWRDYCYVNTLEDAVKRATKGGDAKSAEFGRNIIAFIKKGVPFYDEFSRLTFDNKSANDIRWIAAWAAMRINRSLSGNGVETTKKQSESTQLKVEKLRSKAFAVEQPLLCPGNMQPPVLDGKLSPGEWKDAVKVSGFLRHPSAIAVKNDTEVWLKHDKNNLYMAFKCYETNTSEIKTEKRKHDGNVFADDTIELFIDSNDDEFTYYQMCFNASGSKFDQKCAGAYNYGQSIFQQSYAKRKVRDLSWNAEWTVRTSHDGDSWIAEVAIPFKSIGRESDLMGIHIGRDNRGTDSVTSSWRAIGYFNQPAKFRKVLLCGSRTGNARITAAEIYPLLTGKKTIVFNFAGSSAPVSGEGLLTLKSDKRVPFAGKRTASKVVFSPDLRSDVANLALTMSAADRSDMYKMNVPAHVPNPISFSGTKMVSFKKEGAASANIVLSVSPEEIGKLELICALSKNSAEIAVKFVPLTGEKYKLSFSTTNLPEGVYDLRIALRNRTTGKILASRTTSVIIIPGFMK